jgi:hypothetical protein
VGNILTELKIKFCCTLNLICYADLAQQPRGNQSLYVCIISDACCLKFLEVFENVLLRRDVNELSLSESDLVQARLIKIQVELVKHFELKSLDQSRFVTIRASSQAGSRVNACMLTQFDIYI